MPSRGARTSSSGSKALKAPFAPMDFEQAYADHKNLHFLRKLLGDITDAELLSFLFEGGRWKTSHAPRQIRVANNL
eukprot:4547500-Pleurochrysis_carterae.AAC.1